MAFEIISINRIERNLECDPDYKTIINYNEKEVSCEIYTNSLIMAEGKIFCNKSNFSTFFNGNLYFKLEITNPFLSNLEKSLEKEIISFVKNQNDLKHK